MIEVTYVKKIIVISILFIIAFSTLQANAYSEKNGIERGDNVRMAYKGVLPNGTVFDQKDDIVFKNMDYGNYIEGFVDNVLGMKIGDKKTFDVPPEKGYTNPDHYLYGFTLRFTVEILGIEGYTPGQDNGNQKSENFISKTFTFAAWIFGIILIPVVVVGTYRFLNEKVVNKAAHICAIGGERADGICTKCGTPYCRSHFIKGCQKCGGVTLQPK